MTEGRLSKNQGSRVVRVSPARICGETAPPRPLYPLLCNLGAIESWLEASSVFASLSRPPLFAGHLPPFSLGRVGPRPGTPGLALALRARGLPTPRLAPAGEISAAAKRRARDPWGKVPRQVLGHPGRAFLDHPVGTLGCSSCSVLTLCLKITSLVATTLRLCGCLYIQSFFPAPTPTSSCLVYIVNPLSKHRN